MTGRYEQITDNFHPTLKQYNGVGLSQGGAALPYTMCNKDISFLNEKTSNPLHSLLKGDIHYPYHLVCRGYFLEGRVVSASTRKITTADPSLAWPT